MGNKVYGCDDCLSVCPWNKYATLTLEEDFKNQDEIVNNKLSFFLQFSEKKFKEFFLSSPIKRIGWISFMRNILIATGNSKKSNLKKLVIKFLYNENPIIRGAAIWSLNQLINKKEFSNIKKELIHKEKNKYVKFEWEQINF